MAKKTPMSIEEIRLYNMVDMGLRYSGMIRLYETGTKNKLITKILQLLPQISTAESSKEFDKIHSSFCRWAVKHIFVTGKKRSNIGYGQAAKTLDVTLMVLVYYCKWPSHTGSKRLNKWIYAALDNKMMKHLKQNYPEAIKKWPTAIKQVDKKTYQKLQDLVKRYISEKDKEIKLPVHYEDKYWYLLKEGLPTDN